jgi:hypothetical protein
VLLVGKRHKQTAPALHDFFALLFLILSHAYPVVAQKFRVFKNGGSPAFSCFRHLLSPSHLLRVKGKVEGEG